MIETIVIGTAVVVAVFVAVVALRPADFRIARTATIAAPPEVVFEQVNDFRRWRAWSPWERKDPAMQRTYEGPLAGPGAVYAWAGNKEVGEGRMTLIESRAGELVRVKLEFLKPFAATNTTEFTFGPKGERTVVTWSMTGKNNFVARAFCMFMNMEKMVGGDFEKGLAAMKSVAESKAEPALASAH